MSEKSSNRDQLRHIAQRLLYFRVLLFMLLVVSIYGFIIWRANSLSQTEPNQSSVASQVSTFNNPQIDQATIHKINQLQDNSVSVQALFNQARQNPFQE